ncbi:MAG: hypothetical protein QM731_03645 [Chitinophagaceae bacterium]
MGSIKYSLPGTWEATRAYSDIGAIVYQPGNGHLLKFTSNDKMEFALPNGTVQSGTYRLRMKKDCYTNSDTQLAFTWPGSDYELVYYVVIDNGELSLSTPSCLADGSITYYRKLPN